MKELDWAKFKNLLTMANKILEDIDDAIYNNAPPVDYPAHYLTYGDTVSKELKSAEGLIQAARLVLETYSPEGEKYV